MTQNKGRTSLPGMATGDPPVDTPRLKREDCERTKHDSAFSPWKILVGASDWEDHSSGKEGAERYRTQNLPNIARPGLYELGIDNSSTNSGRKLDPRFIVVVYLGQADCVRTRLQQYGRSGAHLGKCTAKNCQVSCTDKQSGTGLFEEILSRGCNIVFRWAPMISKADAERMELSLLKAFDYAWNKGANGGRRPDDVFQKLGEVSSKTHHLSSSLRKLLHFNSKKVGIKIKGEPYVDEKDFNVGIKIKGEPHVDEKDPTSSYHDRNGSFFRGIVKLTRSRPTPLYGSSSESVGCDTICGITLGNGMICRNAPAKGRKRCPEHKGMKFSARQQPTVPFERICSSEYSNVYQSKHSAVSDTCPAGGSSSLICGVILGDGSSCMKSPVPGRKRCSEHKGMRVGNVMDFTLGAVASPNHLGYTYHGFGKSVNSSSPLKKAGNEEGTICGVHHGDGTICMNKPARGRVRCENHKGMRV